MKRTLIKSILITATCFITIHGTSLYAANSPTNRMIEGCITFLNRLGVALNRPLIKTALPGPKASSILQAQASAESSAVSYPKLFPLVPKRGKGALIEDVDGNQFLDFFGMAGVAALGHSSFLRYLFMSEMRSGVTTTLDFPTEVRVNFLTTLQRLANKHLNMDSVIHLTGPTGTDAVEAALKLARFHTGGDLMIAFSGGYHGMTAGSLAVTSSLGDSPITKVFQKDVTRFVPFPYCPNCSPEEISKMIDDVLSHVENIFLKSKKLGKKVAGAIIEPIQGEGGTIVPPQEFLAKLKTLLHKYNALLIVDEVQTGFGRTGTLFATEASNTSPDILVFSKSASGVGAPIGGIILEKTLNHWPAGSSIGTFRGFNPSFASGVKALHVYSEPSFLADVKNLGNFALDKLKRDLKDIRIVKDIRGKGLMMGIEIVGHDGKANSDLAKKIVRRAFQNGVIVEIGGIHDNVIRILPPLVISKAQLNIGLDILMNAIVAENH